jgi:hypothetical protein
MINTIKNKITVSSSLLLRLGSCGHLFSRLPELFSRIVWQDLCMMDCFPSILTIVALTNTH